MISIRTQIAVAGLLFAALGLPHGTVFAQGTAFAYQGQLDAAGAPANGLYDLTFTLYDSLTGGDKIGTSITNSSTGVTNGLFSQQLDFGANFPGAARWLEIGVRTNGSVAPYATLSPRESLLPMPYAITAENITPGSGLSGTYSGAVSLTNTNNTISGTFVGNGLGLTGVNAASLGGYGFCSLPCYWNLTGNAGTTPGVDFVGTTDNQPLEFWANGGRALRLEPVGLSTFAEGYGYSAPTGAPNVIGGSPVNFVASGVVGAFIGGGGATNYFGSGQTNSVTGDFGTVGGGEDNLAGNGDTVGGGEGNSASGQNATVAGGEGNQASSDSTVGGGDSNFASNGGTVPGGIYNVASGADSFAAGIGSQALHAGTFVWSDDQADIGFVSTGNHQFLIRAGGGVGIGTATPANQLSVAGNANFTGSVGIGTTSPAALLDVDGAQGYVRLLSTSSVNGSVLELRNNTSSANYVGAINFSTPTEVPGQVAYAESDNGLHFRVNNVNDVMKLYTSGLLVNGSMSFTSDRNAKENFIAINAEQVLAKVASLPLTVWNYKKDSKEVQHLGPMAQDFQAAFRLDGADDKHISVSDEGGVALAAIQGLNQKLEEQLERKQTEITELKQRLEKLEQMMNAKKGGAN